MTGGKLVQQKLLHFIMSRVLQKKNVPETRFLLETKSSRNGVNVDVDVDADVVTDDPF